MSCEAILIDRLTGDPLPLDTLIREYGLLRYLHENWGDGPTPPLDLALFIAEDGVTYLNVLRLIHAADWPRWEEEPRQMALALLLQCLGHYPYQLEQGASWPELEKLALRRYPAGELPATVNRWIETEVQPRLHRGLGNRGTIGETGRAVVYRREPSLLRAAGSDGGTAPRVNASRRTLPIDREGLVRVDLTVPDRVGHCYDIAVEIERRYDMIWSRLLERLGPIPPGLDRPEVIPYSRLRPVDVDRTRPLLKHNLFATPLPGSIQAYVFAHPAEFAANASALSAAQIRYAGQTVVLQRQIPLLSRQNAIFRGPSFEGVNWQDYVNVFLRANRYEEPMVDAPSLALGSGTAPGDRV